MRKWEPSVNQVGINIRIYISSDFVANPTPPFPTNQPEYSSSSLSLNSGKILAGGRGKERGEGRGERLKKAFLCSHHPLSSFRFSCVHIWGKTCFAGVNCFSSGTFEKRREKTFLSRNSVEISSTAGVGGNVYPNNSSPFLTLT